MTATSTFVLVADDSPVARALLARRLREAGAPFVEAASALAARAVDPEGLCCALLDLDLGDGDGVEVGLALRARRPGLPLAFFSATSDPSLRARASELGPVFEKPDGLGAATAWALAQRGV